jgi:hypothetical protein
MSQTLMKSETAQEFLLRKGIRKIHQPHKRYNLTISELVEFLNEYAEGVLSSNSTSEILNEYHGFNYKTINDFAI